jgi:lipid-A-disaccharide synthase
MDLGMVAGEASGDLIAGALIAGMRRRWPQLQARGVGGPRMIEQGFEAWWPSHKFSLHGYVEALRHYRELSGIRNQLARRWLDEKPDAFVGIDMPDFNLGLEARLKAGGIKTVHFVCPSIWAWRGGRARKIWRSADLVLCLFPFEPALLQRHGVNAAYVGHPLADAIPLDPPKAEARRFLQLPDDATVVALLPGSRRAEISYIGPAFLQAAALLHRQRPELRFVMPAVPGYRPLLEAMLPLHAPGVPVQIVDGHSHEVLAACDVTLIASGTATLEAALFKRPMVIAYKLHPLSWFIMKHMHYQPWVGLPNILCEDFVVPEMLQGEMQPPALAQAVLGWLDAPARVEALQRRFTDLHHLLRQDTAQRATDAIAQLVEAKKA